MNLAPLLDTIATLAGVVFTACVPIITLKLTTLLGVRMDVEQRATLNAVIETAVGKALQVGQTAGDSALSNVVIKNAALNSATNFVTANAPGALAHFGLSDADVAERIAARLAKLLHETGTAPAPDPAKAKAAAARLAAASPLPTTKEATP